MGRAGEIFAVEIGVKTMDKHELLRIIAQATKDDVTSLDLSNRGLTELPPEIGK
jgi:hypothetical protein